MSDSGQPNPIEILREIGLKEYEARCYVALTRLPSGTAKEVSDVADVPRTRVYDAVDQLQSYGLVDVQHSTPQQFRAIGVEEAVTLLRRQFDERFNTLRGALTDLDSVGEESLRSGTNVWTTAGTDAITSRAVQFIDGATDEIVLVIDGGGESVVSEQLLDRSGAADERGVTIYVGALTESTHEQVQAAVPDVRVFESALEWLQPQTAEEDERIGRLLLVDRSALLLSSLGSHTPEEETAIWSDSVGNGLLIIGRRLLASGLDREEEALDLGEPEAEGEQKGDENETGTGTRTGARGKRGEGRGER